MHFNSYEICMSLIHLIPLLQIIDDIHISDDKIVDISIFYWN